MPPVAFTEPLVPSVKTLDVGACAGPHTRYLMDSGFNVFSIDTSPGAVEYLKNIGAQAQLADFHQFETKDTFDTILMLMNGIGIAGTLAQLETTLLKAKSLLNLIIFDQFTCPE